ncbi:MULTISPECIES: LysR family transcriptional regulator [unclassified Sporolactobacillus]|uniref:LysR family transcriptional regulator n=1 Tax=unclassified Sporolactobacillus TaxID=2628533 RepID=UPI00236795C9|nr:LysR family transcriptional regulator [Sporolactobacillus sp. CQH2019]MDD9147865.1 LysR family transcriptional regulator [Sporolactobacillus sp. CQH2019]
MMTIDQLDAFLAVVKYHSFHLAAEKLFLSQPSISSRIQALERELNAELFVKNGRGVKLSEQGEILIPYAKRMVGTYKKALSKLENGDTKKD